MARAKTPDEIQADIDKKKAKLKQLEKKKQLALARQSEADRKRRNHALITWGAWIESACGGDWAGVDSRLLHAMLDRYGNAYRKLNDHPGRSAKDAADELREYERELRNGGKAEQQPQGEGKPAKKADKYPEPDPAKIEAARARIAEAARKGASDGN